MKYIIVCATLLALTSCAGQLKAADYYARNPAAETVDLQNDGARCEMEAKRYALGAGWAVYASQYNSMYDSCMRSKGYTQKE